MTTAARTCLLAGLAALALAAPGSASEVLRVQGGRSVVVDDPTVPPRSATDLSAPPAPHGGSRASAARARAAAARGPSVTRVLRGRSPTGASREPRTAITSRAIAGPAPPFAA